MSTATTGQQTIAAAFASSGKRAALMPYLMGGFPTLEGSRAIGEAYAEAGADLLELGVPFSDPLADGPVIHAAGSAALAAGATLHDVLEVGRALAESIPVVLMCYANLVLARGPERFADELAQRGVSGLIVPDLPLEEADGALAACDAAGLALVPLVAPDDAAGAARGDRRPRARLRLHGLGHRHHRRARRRWPATSRTSWPARRRRPTCPSRSASASGRPRRRPPRPTRAPTASSSAPGSCAPRRRASGPRTRCVGWWPGSPRPFARIRDRMGILLTTIAGLALWIILWAIDVKSFDAFLITVLMVVIAATAHIVAPFLPGNRSD